MGLSENRTGSRKNQGGWRQRGTCRPRARWCLLKGCARRFDPRQARQRYCSASCRKAARQWRQWKVQQKYRATAGGKQKRNNQSRRYRERVKSRKAVEPEAVKEGARVIPPEYSFRLHLRPSGVLRAVRASAAKSLAAFLLPGLPTRAGAGPTTRAALETSAPLIPTY